MRRGGSTLQAQVVSALLGGAQVRATTPGAILALAHSGPAPDRVRVVKCHEYVHEAERLIESNKARIAYVYRDIRDVVASICAKYSIPAFSFVSGGAAAIISEYEQWSSVPGIHLARYEDMIEDLPTEIIRLGAYLGVEVDPEAATALAEELAIDRQKSRIEKAFASGTNIAGSGDNAHDADSLLHRNHIRSGVHGAYRSVLRWHELAALEWVCRDWLGALGYRADTPRALQALSFTWFSLRSRVHTLRQRHKSLRK
jgi:hypothetical protein